MFRLYKDLVRPVLFCLAPETAHDLAIGSLRFMAHLPLPVSPSAPKLGRTVFGLHFPNPIGLAAGFDKGGVALPAWAMFGFGFVEVGTVTAYQQPGNEKPRIFRLPSSQGLINRLGFNNPGASKVGATLQRFRVSGRWPKFPVGINLGKSRAAPLESAVSDYCASFECLQDFGDYFVINVSSPNTPGLRSLQARGPLEQLIRGLQDVNAHKPLLIKFAPDLDWPAIDELIAIAEARNLAGLVATNTTIDHTSVPNHQRTEGGLSGAPLTLRSREILRFLKQHSRLPVISVGGIMDAAEARLRLDLGADLIQLYTGFIYAGPGLITEVKKLLAQE
ncbi:MAG: quinone-dependent dihydroorotate dehydrogenase [Verrucomicrobia bacterium]|nr:quinone-dependent dihydroorotate dehydrogenase [Verrucomicrobiota bacterium]